MFNFSRSRRSGVILLSLILLFSLCVNILYKKKYGRTPLPKVDSLYVKVDSFYKEKSKKAKHIYPIKKKQHIGEHPFRFDPNLADSNSFIRLGMPSWMARNIMKYRRSGGHFKDAEDFRKVYGLKEEDFLRLRPYISIHTKKDSIKRKIFTPRAQDKYVKEEKYSEVRIMEINTVDTTELKKIPGVGSGIARMIVTYRSKLGGYYSVEQLSEIGLDVEMLTPWFDVDTTLIRKIDVNTANIHQLKRHPYINFYQAKAIVNERRELGNLTSMDVFSLMDEFSPKDLERIKKYIQF